MCQCFEGVILKRQGLQTSGRSCRPSQWRFASLGYVGIDIPIKGLILYHKTAIGGGGRATGVRGGVVVCWLVGSLACWFVGLVGRGVDPNMVKLSMADSQAAGWPVIYFAPFKRDKGEV